MVTASHATTSIYTGNGFHQSWSCGADIIVYCSVRVEKNTIRNVKRLTRLHKRVDFASLSRRWQLAFGVVLNCTNNICGVYKPAARRKRFLLKLLRANVIVELAWMPLWENMWPVHFVASEGTNR